MLMYRASEPAASMAALTSSTCASAARKSRWIAEDAVAGLGERQCGRLAHAGRGARGSAPSARGRRSWSGGPPGAVGRGGPSLAAARRRRPGPVQVCTTASDDARVSQQRRSPRRRTRARSGPRRCARRGAAARSGWRPGVASNASGMPTWRSTPSAGCSTSTDIPSALASGESNAASDVGDRAVRDLGGIERGEPSRRSAGGPGARR